MKPNPKPVTMLRVLHLLTPQQKAICCNVLRQETIRYSGVHQGLLPFVDVFEMKIALGVALQRSRQGMSYDGRSRALAAIVDIMNAMNAKCVQHDQRMSLNDAKVFKLFGAHPERGRALPNVSTKRVTCGVKWSLPKKDHIPDDHVLVQPCVALKRVRPGVWEVQCEEQYRKAAERYLVNNLM